MTIKVQRLDSLHITIKKNILSGLFLHDLMQGTRHMHMYVSCTYSYTCICMHDAVHAASPPCLSLGSPLLGSAVSHYSFPFLRQNVGQFLCRRHDDGGKTSAVVGRLSTKTNLNPLFEEHICAIYSNASLSAYSPGLDSPRSQKNNHACSSRYL